MSNALKTKAACKMVEECKDTWNITISGGTPEMIVFPLRIVRRKYLIAWSFQIQSSLLRKRCRELAFEGQECPLEARKQGCHVTPFSVTQSKSWTYITE
jgi:hypothetical protein